MPLFSREKSSLKGRWRLETVQDMRSSSSNPVSCSETSIKIYGSKEEIRARKSPETVDAPGFAPDASIPVTLYGAAGRIRTADLILTKKPWTLLRRTHSCRGRTSNPLCCKGLEVLLVLMCFNTYREVLRRFGAFVGRIVGKMPCVRRKAATQEKSRFECATLATGMSTSPLKWECSFASALSHKQEYLRICSLPFQRCSYQPQP